jgi:hypothetical protein
METPVHTTASPPISTTRGSHNKAASGSQDLGDVMPPARQEGRRGCPAVGKACAYVFALVA